MDHHHVPCAGKLGAFLLRPEDITICRGPDGRKVVLGEGGFSMVYKGAMNGVDEVAVKVGGTAGHGAKGQDNVPRSGQ